MSHYIPKLQYKNYDLSGTTTNGSNVITGISVPNAKNIEVGMFVRGAGIPTGALVTSKTSTTATFSGSPATASATITVGYGFEIIFMYPPIEPDGENYDPKEIVSASLSGVKQTIVDYIEVFRTFSFSFLSETLKLQMDTFAKTWFCLGKTFRYFDDQTSSTYVEWEAKDLKYKPVKITSKGANLYVWKIGMSFRRIL